MSRSARTAGIIVVVGLVIGLKMALQSMFDSDWIFSLGVLVLVLLALVVRSWSSRDAKPPVPGQRYECAIGGCSRIGEPDRPLCADHDWERMYDTT